METGETYMRHMARYPVISLSLKSAKQPNFENEEKAYDAELKLEGYHTFIYYGIAFYKKLCRILSKRRI